jgi:hypothetical protein
MKIRLIRGVTIAEEPPWDRKKSALPPTFAPGDVVDVARNLAHELVGNGKARFLKEAVLEAEPVVETASIEPPARMMTPAPKARKGR